MTTRMTTRVTSSHHVALHTGHHTIPWSLHHAGVTRGAGHPTHVHAGNVRTHGVPHHHPIGSHHLHPATVGHHVRHWLPCPHHVRVLHPHPHHHLLLLAHLTHCWVARVHLLLVHHLHVACHARLVACHVAHHVVVSHLADSLVWHHAWPASRAHVVGNTVWVAHPEPLGGGCSQPGVSVLRPLVRHARSHPAHHVAGGVRGRRAPATHGIVGWLVAGHWARRSSGGEVLSGL